MSAPLVKPNAYDVLFEADDHPLICFSHLRWDFVLQRPQHLMQRFSAKRRVFFFEEHIPTDHHLAYLEYHPFEGTEVVAVRPRLPRSWNEAEREQGLAEMLDVMIKLNRIHKPVLWFYTPMMFGFARHLDAAAVVYDCMDELANFRFAPPRLRSLEAELLQRSDAVFTGGYSLYEAKRHAHGNIHPFPSSVDTAHFAKARRPRSVGKQFGFYGVVDERMDLELLAQVADMRPDWMFEIVGPVVKINPVDLPKAPNLRFVGQRDYADLPEIVSRWDVALMPFAVNEATRFISPTKTPEYLAAGKPVVTTPVPDVVRQYGEVKGVSIAAGASAFVAACEEALELAAAPASWLPEVDAILSEMSWDKTAGHMDELVHQAIQGSVVPLRRVNGRPMLGISTVPA
ncbi:MAG: UDP-galactopyranose mutase [Devosia sp.]|jgi:UDP-galactopyranose mutase|nr:UDP-galactopyranose mutase [Devosia sp.]